MSISALIPSGLLKDLSYLTLADPLQKTSKKQQSTAPDPSVARQLAPDTYTPSQQTSSHPPPPANTLTVAQLAKNQTIDGSLAARIAIDTGEHFYRTPLQQFLVTTQTSLASGDLSTAQSALAAYTKALPTTNEYLSPLTTPSAQFLSDLKDLGSALSSGNLSDAKAVFSKTQHDQPDSATGAYALAFDRGDAVGAASVLKEAAANDADYLVTQGYTRANAIIEANALQIGALTDSGRNTPGPDQAQTDQSVDQLARVAASSSAAATAIFQSLAAATFSTAADNAVQNTLARLETTYGIINTLDSTKKSA